MRAGRVLAAVATVAALILGGAGLAAASPQPQPSYDPVSQLVAARNATAKFASIAVAKRDHYQQFFDIHHVTCIADPMGGMGVHYVDATYVKSANLYPTHPAAAVYAPDAHHHLKLAAVEYIVLQANWSKAHHGRPSLFGQPFDFTPAGNRYNLPAFYSLHVWLYRDNPAGLFAMWNPSVHC